MPYSPLESLVFVLVLLIPYSLYHLVLWACGNYTNKLFLKALLPLTPGGFNWTNAEVNNTIHDSHQRLWVDRVDWAYHLIRVAYYSDKDTSMYLPPLAKRGWTHEIVPGHFDPARLSCTRLGALLRWCEVARQKRRSPGEAA